MFCVGQVSLKGKSSANPSTLTASPPNTKISTQTGTILINIVPPRAWQKVKSENVSRSVVSDSATPWTVACQAPLSMTILQARITGLGSHSVLQGIFTTQGSNPGLKHCRRILYHLSHQGSPCFNWYCTSCSLKEDKIVKEWDLWSELMESPLV